MMSGDFYYQVKLCWPRKIWYTIGTFKPHNYLYMHEPTYRQALTHAWHLVWHNKILWAFGIILVFAPLAVWRYRKIQ
jgi:hypothetical protein